MTRAKFSLENSIFSPALHQSVLGHSESLLRVTCWSQLLGARGLVFLGLSLLLLRPVFLLRQEGKAWAGSVAFVGEWHRLQRQDERNKSRFPKLYF